MSRKIHTRSRYTRTRTSPAYAHRTGTGLFWLFAIIVVLGLLHVSGQLPHVIALARTLLGV